VGAENNRCEQVHTGVCIYRCTQIGVYIYRCMWHKMGVRHFGYNQVHMDMSADAYTDSHICANGCLYMCTQVYVSASIGDVCPYVASQMHRDACICMGSQM